MKKEKTLDELSKQTLKEEEEETKELTLLPQIDAKFGASLVEAGLKARQDKLSDQCVSAVEHLLSQISTSELNIRVETMRLEVYRKRVEAIRKGEIELVPSGGNNLRIKYKDDSLDPEVLHY